MYIDWIESRNKKTGITWRKIFFQQVNVIQSEDAALPGNLLQLFKDLQQFALGTDYTAYANTISRIGFHGAHQEYLWFAKSTLNEEGFAMDEEEIYTGEDHMLLRRGFGVLTIEDGEALPIDVTKTVLVTNRELPDIQAIYTAFGNIHSYTLTDDTLADALQEMQQLPHGHVLLIDGTALSQPVDLSAVTTRTDLQIFAIGCVQAPTVQLIAKGKMISSATL